MQENFVEYILSEHRKADKLIEEARTKLDKGTSDLIIEKLSKHSYVEETLLYPLLSDTFKNKEWSDKCLHDHSEVKAALINMDKFDPQSERENFLQALAKIEKLVKNHNTYEEKNILPMFSSKFDKDILGKLGHMAARLEKHGPARPDSTTATYKKIPKQFAQEFDAVCDAMKSAMTA